MQLKKIILTSVIASFVLGALLIPVDVYAQLYLSQQGCQEGDPKDIFEPIGITLQVYIPGVASRQDNLYAPEFNNGKFECVGEHSAYYVSSLQDYISGVYNFGIGLIALSAVIVMMIGGFQYVLAGGNQTRIGTAKSLISGALGGLALSLLSYTLLNTINPRITSLQVKSPNPVTGIQRVVFCSDVPSQGSGGIPPSSGGFIRVSDVPTPPPANITYNIHKEDTWCGLPYYIRGTNLQTTCLGLKCDAGQGCVGGTCLNAYIYGNYDYEGDRFVDNNIDIMAVCQSPALLGGKIVTTLLGYDQDDNRTHNVPYALGGTLALANCDDGTNIKYFLRLDVNDPGGIDDYYYYGKHSCSAHIPLVMCKTGNTISCADKTTGKCAAGQETVYDPSDFNAEVLYGCDGSFFWSQADMDAAGQSCNILITEADFPEDYTP